MGKCSKKDMAFHSKRVVPPGKRVFFFNYQGQTCVNPGYPIEYPQQTYLDKITVNGICDQSISGIECKNVIQVEINRQTVSVVDDYSVNYTVKPRTQEIYYIAKNSDTNNKWLFSTSIMKDWKQDDQNMLDRCFEEDWSHSRIYKIVKDEEILQQVKVLLRSVYYGYREVYKYYGSVSPVGDIWSLSTVSFAELIDKLGVIDPVLLVAADVNIKFVGTANNLVFKGNNRNPVRGLVRFELLECLVRIADEKYLKKGQQVACDHLQAVQMLLDNHCRSVFSQFDNQKWRQEVYWNEECDLVFKTYKPVLEHIYKKYSVKKVKPGQKPFMCLDELGELIRTADLIDEYFVEKDIGLSFNLSMMTQVDELNSDRIFQMTFVEFLEAIARIAEKCSPNGLDQIENVNVDRFSQALHLKTEALIVNHLIRYNCDLAVKDQWLRGQRKSLFLSKKRCAEDSDEFDD